MSPVLAAMAGLLAFAAAWELAGMGRPPGLALERVAGALDAIARRHGPGSGVRPSLVRRLRRAGIGRFGAGRFLAVKASGALAGGLGAIAVLPATPARLAPVIGLGLLAAGFMAPDAWAERAARRRSQRVVAALPDALDLLAVGAAAGRAPASMLGELARGSGGPLGAELAMTAADIQAGVPQAVALRDLRERLEIPELGVLVATLERSRRYGSPLAEQLHARAATLRSGERRRIEEGAARAAPKIQLVVALLLVPSSLLAIAAALIAHADTLFQALR